MHFLWTISVLCLQTFKKIGQLCCLDIYSNLYFFTKLCETGWPFQTKFSIKKSKRGRFSSLLSWAFDTWKMNNVFSLNFRRWSTWQTQTYTDQKIFDSPFLMNSSILIKLDSTTGYKSTLNQILATFKQATSIWV